MGSGDLVSVVIPTYNAEKYIQECLDATINQTYRNIEILIMDDGSDDSTVEICRQYAVYDPRIRLFSHENSGASEARNRGISNAKGDYIVFFDADDYPEHNLIEKYIEAKNEWHDKDVSFILCGMFNDNRYNKYVENCESILESAHGYIRGEKYLLERSSAATLSWLKLFNFVTNKFYDLKVINEKGISFDPDIAIGEDLKFNIDYLDNSDGYIGMINEPLYHYIKRCDCSLSLSYHEGDIEDTKEIYRRLVAWEASQNGATKDNVLLIKGIYVTDWVSRLTALYEKHYKSELKPMVKKTLRSELRCNEFRNLITEVYKAGKLSTIRYYSLRIGSYEAFFFLRDIYKVFKG